MSYQKYTTISDRRVCNKLLKAAIDKGYTVSVNDGEEWTLKQSNSIKEIKDHLATTDEDYLRIRDKDKTVLGSFWIIWDNDDESPICDYSCNGACEELYRLAHS